MKYNLILAVIFWILSLAWIIFIIFKKWPYLQENSATLSQDIFNRRLRIISARNILYNFLNKTILRLHLFTLKFSNKTGSWLEKIRINRYKNEKKSEMLDSNLDNEYWRKLKEKK